MSDPFAKALSEGLGQPEPRPTLSGDDPLSSAPIEGLGGSDDPFRNALVEGLGGSDDPFRNAMAPVYPGEINDALDDFALSTEEDEKVKEYRSVSEWQRNKRRDTAIMNLDSLLTRALRKDPVSGRTVLDDYPQLARRAREALRQFPDMEIANRVRPEEIPLPDPHWIESAMDVGAGTLVGAGVGFRAGGVLGGVLGGAAGGALGKHLLTSSMERGEAPGSRWTPSGLAFGALGTLGRVSAATGLFWEEHRIGDLTGHAEVHRRKTAGEDLSFEEEKQIVRDHSEGRWESVGKALLSPQSMPHERPRDWTWMEEQIAIRDGIDPTSPEVVARGLAKDVFYDAGTYLMFLTKTPQAMKAIDQIGTIMRRAAKTPNKSGVTIQPQLVDAFVGSAQRKSGEIFQHNPFWDAVPKVQSMLKKNYGDWGDEAARLFDKEGFALGRKGLRVSFIPAKIAAIVPGVAGGATNVAGAIMELPFAAAQGALSARMYPRAAQAARAGRIPGEVVGVAGKGLRKSAEILGRLGKEFEVIPARFLVSASRPAELAGDVLRKTPWGNLMGKTAGYFSTQRELFPAGAKAAVWPGQSSFEAFASNKALYEQRVLAAADEAAAASSLSTAQILEMAQNTSTISHQRRAGRTLKNFLTRSWGTPMRTHIDKSSRELYETAIGEMEIPDQRGFIQAVFEWASTRAKEHVDEGRLIRTEEFKSIQFAAIQRKARFLARADRITAAAAKADDKSGARVAKMRAAASEAEARYNHLEQTEGELVAELAQARRRVYFSLDETERVGKHGLDPHRGTHGGEEYVSVAKIAGKENIGQWVPAHWEHVPRPKGARKGRIYFKTDDKIPSEKLAEADKTFSRLGKELDKTRRQLDALAGKDVDLRMGAIDADLRAILKLRESIDDVISLEAKSETFTREVVERAATIERDLTMAIRRAYSGSTEAARKDPFLTAEAELSRRIGNVERQFQVDLTDTWRRGSDLIGDDTSDLAELHLQLDTELKSLYEFAEKRYRTIFDGVRREFGEKALAEFEGYTRHVILNKDRIMRRYPSKVYVSGFEVEGAHREVLTVRELKDGGYDPVEDVLSSLSAAEAAYMRLKVGKNLMDNVLGDSRWAISVNDPRAKGLVEEWDRFTHPVTGEEFVVPKPVFASLNNYIALAQVGDPGGRLAKLEEMAQTFERYLITPWKSWATYTRAAFHLRNAYSNLWLMWMGGYNMAERPDVMSKAIQIGSISQLGTKYKNIALTRGARTARLKDVSPEGLAESLPFGGFGKRGAKAAAKFINTTRPMVRGVVSAKRKAMDFAEDAWGKQLQAWADEVHTSKSGRKYTGGELYDYAAKHGVVNKRWQAADVDPNLMSTLRFTRKWDPASAAWKMIPLSQDSHVLKFGSAAGQFVENHSRMSLFIDRVLHHGDHPADAAMNVKAHLFDYKDLTTFERKVLRRVIPFYAWARKATAHEMHSLAEYPSRYATIPKVQRAYEAKHRQRMRGPYNENAEYKRAVRNAGDFHRSSLGWWAWNTTPTGGAAFWPASSMPFGELERFGVFTDVPQIGPGEAAASAGFGFLESVAPVWKLPIAALTRTKFPERRPLKLQVEGPMLTLNLLKTMGVKVHTKKDVDSGRPVELVDELPLYALHNSFPHLYMASKLFDNPRHDPALEVSRQYSKRAEFSGVRLHPVDPVGAEAQEARAVARSLHESTGMMYRYAAEEDTE
jgi:hypothetical protein